MKSRTLVVMAASLFVLAACDSNTTGVKGAGNVTLSFASSSTSTSNVLADLISSDSVTVGGHTIILSNVDVSFSRIMLKKVETEDTSKVDDDRDSTVQHEAEHDEHDGDAIRFDSATVALPLGGGVITPISKPIPAGDYRSIELGLSSVRIRGTYDGQAFDVSVPVHSEFRQEFNTPLHVASDTDKVNVTIKIATAGWFKNGSSLIDPRQVTSSEQLRSIVAKNIRNSFKSFRDHDRNGHDDDHNERD